METERLLFIRREQKRLRADSYQHLRDSLLHDDGDPRNVGQRVILPSTFTGGPRYMHERQMDAMTYVRRFGRPDLFITMTTNPKWDEISTNLLPGQESHDRPDLIARVFRLKLKKLMEFLKKGVFGEPQAWLYSIEFQKRGLPHAYILLWLKPACRIEPDGIDKVIVAEIPCQETDPTLHNIVKANMVHGPCGTDVNPHGVCMKNGSCSKKYPRQFITQTQQGIDGYPKYRRRASKDGGHTAKITVTVNGQREEREIDNKWIVPYNPWLLRQMNCHVNVELCMSIHSIKYVLKYVTKGCDQAVFALQSPENVDEIQQFQQARYVGSSEAAWRILDCPLHERFPPFMQLAVHLENGQRVYFTEATVQERAEAEPPQTTLTEYFALNRTDSFAQSLLYLDLPRFYTWDKAKKVWSRRKHGNRVPHEEDIFEAQAIGRVYTVSPRQGECYYLCLLLHEVCGATSFDDLKTVSGDICPTFREACRRRGLLENDNQYSLALEEAAMSQMPSQVRTLYAIILTTCEPSDPLALWETHRNSMTEDFLHRHRLSLSESDLPFSDDMYDQALIDVQEKLLRMGGQELSTYGLPVPAQDAGERLAREYRQETNYNVEEQASISATNQQRMTADQRTVFDKFMAVVHTNASKLVYISHY